MTDVTVKKFDELESHKGEGRFVFVGRSLGVTAWGMNLENFPPGWDGYPEHDHTDDGQEEVFIPLKGSATLHSDGNTWTLEPGMIVRVGPAAKRRIVPGADGVTLLALGGTPGKPYKQGEH